MSKRYYVMATLGSSPAVLTELLWALCVIEGVHIAGLEVWTTGGDAAPKKSGQAELKSFMIDGKFGELCRALPETTLPEFAQPSPPERALDRLARGGCPYSVHVFTRDGVALGDVRDGEDARAMDVQLFERVRTLREQLPETVHLLGSLAGGRKTMSSSLQSAFSLQARPHDRLVHVLLHAQIEAQIFAPQRQRPKDADRLEFTVPDPKWGLPLEDQIELHDVRFPRLRPLLRGSPLKAAIDGLDYGEVVEMLDAVARDDLRAELTRLHDTAWRYTVRSVGGGVQRSVTLSDRQGQALWLIVEARAPLAALDLYAAFTRRHAPLEDAPLEDHDKGRRDLVAGLVRRLRKRLAPLAAVGLTAFTVDSVRKCYRVPAAQDGQVDLCGSFVRS